MADREAVTKIFDEYFQHSKGGDRAKQLSDETYSRCDQFVVSVLEYAGIRSSKNRSTRPVWSKNIATEHESADLELTDNLEGFERTDNLD